ncbi:hypothetical protein [Flavobacterium sp.]|uniref:hypothetical protein n=1 Tax=Flavobacterium sp. TaxID=239 RepID=UPI00260E2048|nr:hypothetical protein [Flavobacterium sp.]
MAYELKINLEKSELEVSFDFDTTFTIVSSTLSLIFILTTIYFIELETVAQFFAIISLSIVLGNVSISGWLEWKKNRFKKLVIRDNNLFINDTLISPVYAIKSINLSYNIDEFESGYTVYLNFVLKPDDIVIKKRLTKRDAVLIANEIAKLLGKPVHYD